MALSSPRHGEGGSYDEGSVCEVWGGRGVVSTEEREGWGKEWDIRGGERPLKHCWKVMISYKMWNVYETMWGASDAESEWRRLTWEQAESCEGKGGNARKWCWKIWAQGKWNRQEKEDEWEPREGMCYDHSSLPLRADGRTSELAGDNNVRNEKVESWFSNKKKKSPQR